MINPEIVATYDKLVQARKTYYARVHECPEFVGEFARDARHKWRMENLWPLGKEVENLQDKFVKLVRNSEYHEMFVEYADYSSGY